MNDKNLQRLLHVSPSPEELTITEQMAKDKEEGNTLETYLRNSLFLGLNYLDLQKSGDGNAHNCFRIHEGFESVPQCVIIKT